MLGLSDDLPNSVRTFVTFDFFINETKHTGLKTGYNPQFDHIICFKNKVDNFYIKYLSQEHIQAEVFAVKGSGHKVTEKIGEAKLPLMMLLQGDSSTQA